MSSSSRDVALHPHVANTLLLHLLNARVHLLFGLGGLLRLAQVVDRHVCSVLGESNRHCLADSGGAASDQDAFALDTRHRFAPRRRGDRIWHESSSSW
jgi:hypothetical protein